MSSNKNRRNLRQIDYNILHKTGEKVFKNMSKEQEVLEAKIAEDIKYFFDIYELIELVSGDEINEAIETAMQYSKNFRDVHTELRLGIENYRKVSRV